MGEVDAFAFLTPMMEGGKEKMMYRQPLSTGCLSLLYEWLEICQL